MTDYIEREALIEHIKDLPTWMVKDDGRLEVLKFPSGMFDCEDVVSSVENAPAADVAPVVHSYWEEYSCSQYMGTDECGEPKWRDGRFFVCHNYKCRRKTVIKSNYCPNCGARMDCGDKNNG